MPGSVRYTRDFASGRRVRGAQRRDEPPLRGRERADQHRREGRPPPRGEAERDRAASPARWRWVVGVRRRARRRPPPRRRGRSSTRPRATCRRTRARRIVVAGDEQPAAVHALAHAINQALGNVGATVVYTRAGRGGAGRPDRVAPRAGRRHAGGQGRRAADPRRQPGLRRAGRPRSSARRWRRSRFARTSGSTTTRPSARASGTCRRRTSSRRGATRARSTAR